MCFVKNCELFIVTNSETETSNPVKAGGPRSGRLLTDASIAQMRPLASVLPDLLGIDSADVTLLLPIFEGDNSWQP
jgi:hypothetical protein